MTGRRSVQDDTPRKMIGDQETVRIMMSMIELCFRLPRPDTLFYLPRFVPRFRMSAPVRLYATRSSANPAVTLYNALAEELVAETNASTPVPRRSKRIKPGDEEEVYTTQTSVGDSRLATRESGRPTKRVNVERVTGANTEDEGISQKRRSKSSRPKAPKKQKPVQQSLDKPHPSPEHWKEQYDTIKSMRARVKAPVDTMGCDQAQNGETDPKVHITVRAHF